MTCGEDAIHIFRLTHEILVIINLSTYLIASNPVYFPVKSGFGSDKKSLSISRARDFCTSLQYGVWNMNAPALSNVNLVFTVPAGKKRERAWLD